MKIELHSLLDEAGAAANTMAGDVAKLTVLLGRVIYATKECVTSCDILDVYVLLRDLAEADTFLRGHHNDRYKEESRKDYDLQSKECHDDWTECCRRRDRAVEGLIKYAHLYVENLGK
jgi:hypothetical protein